MGVSGSTAFGLFDNDAAFQADGPRIVRYVSVKLGGGLPGVSDDDETHVQVELSSSDVYVAFEEAVVEYGAIINAYQAKSSLAAFLGSATGSLTGGQSRYPRQSLEWARRQAQPFGAEANVGGDTRLYSTSIGITGSRNHYDLQNMIAPTGSDGLPARMLIRTIYHHSPFAGSRYFGQMNSSAYLGGQFGATTFTTDTVYHLMPVFEDVLRGMQFELSNKVRRSNYSFEMHNNVLTLFPAPVENNTLHFTYNLVNGPLNDDDAQSHGVSSVANIPFGNIEYGKINSIGKQWIWKMTLALSKEVMGLIRRKMQTVPIPGGDLSLDGGELVSDARQEMEALRAELRDLLEQMSYDRLAAKEAEQAESLLRVLSGVPLKIYTG